MPHPCLLDLPRLRREHERALRTPRPNGMAAATWVRLATERAALSDRPLAVAGRYDRAAIMAAAVTFAHVRRGAGAREPWRVLMSQGLRGAWIAARRALPASTVPTEADVAAMWAELGDEPSPSSYDMHSDAYDEAMCAWHDAEPAEPAVAVDGLPAHVPRAA